MKVKMRITLTPASIEYECKKCGVKKFKSTLIVPSWLADTGRPICYSFKPYRPKEHKDEKKKH